MLSFPKRVSVTISTYFFWRDSVRDDLYGVPGNNLLRTGRLSRARYIGTQPDFELMWQVNRHTTFKAFYAYFIMKSFF